MSAIAGAPKKSKRGAHLAGKGNELVQKGVAARKARAKAVSSEAASGANDAQPSNTRGDVEGMGSANMSGRAGGSAWQSDEARGQASGFTQQAVDVDHVCDFLPGVDGFGVSRQAVDVDHMCDFIPGVDGFGGGEGVPDCGAGALSDVGSSFEMFAVGE